MALWAYLEVKVASKEFHSVWLEHSGWYCMRFRAYKQIKSECLSALVLNTDTYTPRRETGTDKLPDDVLPLLHNVDDDTYVSRPFFLKTRKHRVLVDDVACFRVELPALPSVLASAALFIEVELVRLPSNKHAVIMDDTTSEEKGRPEIIDAKVFRLSNLASDIHEYVPCNFDDDQFNAVAHLVIDSALLRVGVAKPIAQKLSRKPCHRYREWRRIISGSTTPLVQSWFLVSNNLEYELYLSNVSPKKDNLRQLSTNGSESRIGGRDDRKLDMPMTRRFISQIVQGNHACGELFGIELDRELQGEDNVRHLAIADLAAHDHYILSIMTYTMMYISAKVLAENVVPIAQRPHICNSDGAETVTCESRQTTDSCSYINRQLFTGNATLTFDGGEVKAVDPGDVEGSTVGKRDLFVPVANGNIHVDLCHRLNCLTEALGIRKYNNDKIAIQLKSGITILFDEIKIENIFSSTDGITMERAINKLVSGLCTWLYLAWNHLTEVPQSSGNLSYDWIKRHCSQQSDFFKKISEENIDEPTMVALLQKLKVTDEHHFFVANCFPFVRHVHRNPSFAKEPRPPLRESEIHLVVLVHGYNSSPMTMCFIRNTIVAFAEKSELLLSQYLTDSDALIEQQGQLLAQEVDVHIRRKIGSNRLGRLSFITHSLGGVVVRAALRHLGQYLDKLHALVSFACPHLGVFVSQYSIKGAGVSMLASYMRSPCIDQLLLADADTVEDSYIYELAGDTNISHFYHVKLVGILQDLISPASSCLLDPSLSSVKRTSINSMCQRVSENIQNVHLDKFYVNYQGASKFVRWKSIDAHLHIVDKALLARYFFFLTFDIF
ncbi:serine esterase [Babesia ovis]|uniref:Serine esterase n=1 Tax=Babesia ovis TaxID=5869 RepID=A0A9W5WVL4_BABOV|nr:serine esterase [Babesia ovis]